MSSQYQVHLAFWARKDAPLAITIEPWAERFVLEAGERLSILISAPDPGQPVIEHYPEEILVWGFANSIAAVFKDEQMIWTTRQRLSDSQAQQQQQQQ